jgi:ribosomal silencing factor RsfS
MEGDFMITEYFVICANDSTTLQDAVNEAIQNGWQPLGGIGVSVQGSWQHLVQAVVKMADED